MRIPMVKVPGRGEVNTSCIVGSINVVVCTDKFFIKIAPPFNKESGGIERTFMFNLFDNYVNIDDIFAELHNVDNFIQISVNVADKVIVTAKYDTENNTIDAECRDLITNDICKCYMYIFNGKSYINHISTSGTARTWRYDEEHNMWVY